MAQAAPKATTTTTTAKADVDEFAPAGDSSEVVNPADYTTRLADALGVPAGTDTDKIVALAVEAIEAGASVAELRKGRLNSGSTAVRVTVAEVDGTGATVRQFGALIALSQANPAAIGAVVARTVETDILAIPVGPVPGLIPEPVGE